MIKFDSIKFEDGDHCVRTHFLCWNLVEPSPNKNSKRLLYIAATFSEVQNKVSVWMLRPTRFWRERVRESEREREREREGEGERLRPAFLKQFFTSGEY